MCIRDSKYAADKYGPERHKIVTLINSFHGRTIATLTATGQEEMHRDVYKRQIWRHRYE